MDTPPTGHPAPDHDTENPISPMETPADEKQFECRFHRNMQTRPVTITYLNTADMIDECLDAKMKEKRAIFPSAPASDTENPISPTKNTISEPSDLLTQFRTTAIELKEKNAELRAENETLQKELDAECKRAAELDTEVAKVNNQLRKINSFVLGFAPNLSLSTSVVEQQTAMFLLPHLEPLTWEECEQMKERFKVAIGLLNQLQSNKKRTLKVKTTKERDAEAIESARRHREATDPIRKREVKREKAQQVFDNKHVQKFYNNLRAIHPTWSDEKLMESARKMYDAAKE